MRVTIDAYGGESGGASGTGKKTRKKSIHNNGSGSNKKKKRGSSSSVFLTQQSGKSPEKLKLGQGINKKLARRAGKAAALGI